MQGSPELLEFAYEAGIGEKNAMGFGCLQYVGLRTGGAGDSANFSSLRQEERHEHKTRKAEINTIV